MRWADECELVAETTERDALGVATHTHTRRRVFCNVRSLTTAAYYAAAQMGVRIKAQLEVRRADYHGEQLVCYGGEFLRAERIEQRADTVILTLAEAGGDADAGA